VSTASQDDRFDRFGRLTLIRQVGKSGFNAQWLCWCDCGAEKIARLDKLRSGATKSCGCLHRELVAAAKKARTDRLQASEGLRRQAALDRDECRLARLRRERGEIDYRHFDLVDSPRIAGREFREWAFLVAAVLWNGGTEDKIRIRATIERLPREGEPQQVAKGVVNKDLDHLSL
jgi:hypothetical protein